MPPLAKPVTRSGIGFANLPAGAMKAGLQVSVDISPTPVILAKKFDNLGQDIRSYKVPLTRSIKEVVAPSFKKNFDVGGRPDSWELLSDYTVKRRKYEGRGGTTPLVRSRRLQRTAGQLNIWTIRGPQGEAFIQSLPAHSWYGVLHQSGYGNVATGTDTPARPWALLQDSDVGDIEAVFADWIQERIDKNMGRF